MPPKCAVCGRFMNFKEDFIQYGPYGGPLDLEPPEIELIHRTCFEAQPKESQESTKRIAYTWTESWKRNFAKAEDFEKRGTHFGTDIEELIIER